MRGDRRCRRRLPPHSVCAAVCLALTILAGGPHPAVRGQEAAATVVPQAAAAETASGRVSRLAALVESGGVTLRSHPRHGILPDLLAALDIPVSSQTLVFSKTSFQSHRIDPAHPRAIFFNDDTYVGWLPDSELIEIASVDDAGDAVFHTLEDRQGESPRMVRDTDQCIICHASQRTQGVPGFLVRSVLTAPSGRFVSGAPTHVTDDASPFAQRWGGWYVTGTHGSMRHMGNSTYPGHTLTDPFDLEAGANRLALPGGIDVSAYPVASSDIVALLVLEHQTRLHNVMARAAAEARAAARLDAQLDAQLGRLGGQLDVRPSAAARLRIAEAADDLLRCLLAADGIAFTAPVRGTSGFAAEFAARGPRDAHGRSLRQLDLDRRLFSRPLSHLVHGRQFAALPEPVRRHLGGRLHEILCAGRTPTGYEHVGEEDREAIASILAATEPVFWWGLVVPPPIAPPADG